MMLATAIARESSRTTSIRDLGELLAEVDALPPETSGEYALSSGGGDLLGVVFVERGRVAWAAARGLARRLSDLLGARASLSASAMEDCYRTCTREGIPLGEFLVARGILGADCLRATLLQHTVESLHTLLRTRTHAAFRPRERGYAARFTFSTAEVLAAVGRQDDAAAQLGAYFGQTGWGAAFARGDASTPRLVALAGAHPDEATSIARLGRWAASVLDLAAAVVGAAPLLSSRVGEGTRIALEAAGYLLAFEVPSLGAARILNRRATLRRARETTDGRL